jgi:hypothetical protein
MTLRRPSEMTDEELDIQTAEAEIAARAAEEIFRGLARRARAAKK